MNLAATMTLNTAGFLNPLAGARAALGGIKNTLTSMAAPLAALAGVGGVGALFLKSIQAASADESLAAKLKVLTKDATVAKRTLKDLNQFADVTPFEPEPVQRAGVALIGAKFAAKDLRSILTDVGDLAAGGIGDMSQNLDEVVNAFARMKSGQFGEAFEILRRFSISTKDLKAEGLQFDAGGQFKGSAEKAIDAVRAVIRQRFGGTMAEMSKTTEGLFSTLQGNITAVFREFGAPLLAPIKEALQAAITFSTDLISKAKDWGGQVANAANVAVQVFKAGDLGSAAGLSLKIGFGEAVNFLAGALKGTFVAVVSLLADGINGAVKILSKGDLYSGIALVFDGLMNQLAAGLKTAFADAFQDVQIMGKNILSKESADLLRGGADTQADAGRRRAGIGAEMLGRAAEGSGAGFIDSILKAAEKFKISIQSTKVIDTAQLRAQWLEIVRAAQKEMSAAKAKMEEAVPSGRSAGDAVASASSAIGGKALGSDGDRFSKIGLFVGSGGPANEHARQIAQNTSKQVSLTQRMIEILGRVIQNNQATPGVAWA